MTSTTRTAARAAASVGTALTLSVLGVTVAGADETSPSETQGHSSEQRATAEPGYEGGQGGDATDKSGSADNPDGEFQGKSESTPDQDGTGMDRGFDNNDKSGSNNDSQVAASPSAAPGSGSDNTDGNNGCGNEPRAESPRDGGRPTEDDNNGWCGGKPASTPTSTDGTTDPATTKSDDGRTGGEAKSSERRGPSLHLGDLVSAPVFEDGPGAVADVPAVASLVGVRVVPGAADIGAPAGLRDADVTEATATRAAPVTAAGGAELPLTGAPIAALVALGAGLTSAGGALLRVGRRRGGAYRP